MNQRTQPKKPAWQRYLPVIYLVVLGGGALAIVAWLRPVSEPDSLNTTESEQTVGSLDDTDENTSDEEYVRLAEQADTELLAKLRRRKDSRVANQDREGVTRQYESTLAEKQYQFEQIKKSADDERSIAYGMQQEIEAMQADPPSMVD